MLKLTTDKYEASRGLSATAELLLILIAVQMVKTTQFQSCFETHYQLISDEAVNVITT